MGRDWHGVRNRPDGGSRERDAVSVAIVEKIAALDDGGARSIPPLYQSVDTDALERLAGDGGPDGVDRIEFSHAGYEVTVDGTGAVSVTDA